jgi:hypothetical protein
MLAGLGQPGFTPRPPDASPVAPAAGPASDGGTTSGGLTRRVRGAQLPTTNPLAVRRASPGSVPGAVAGPVPPMPARTQTPARTADAVYSFLTHFSAGVQRGLDETRPGH